MMSKTVYTLTDPRTGCVYYVGAARRPRKRLSMHISLARVQPEPYNGTTADILAAGMRPVLGLVGDGRTEAEVIRDMRASGVKLVNINRGSDWFTH